MFKYNNFKFFKLGFNNYENSFLAHAIKILEPRYRTAYGNAPDPFYLGCSITFVLIREGPDKEKLTVGMKNDGGWVLDPNIEPADCYNLWTPGLDLATAVRKFERELKSKRVSNCIQ